MGTDKRERQKANRQKKMEELHRAEKKNNLRSRIILFSTLAALILGALYLVSVVGGDDDSTEQSATAAPFDDTETDDTETDVPENGGAEADDPATADAGDDTVDPNAPECPPEEGAAERTTEFAAAPPMCIDVTKTYTAVVSTTMIAAYGQGFFPMPLTLPLSDALRAGKRTEIGWFHPLERAVFLPGDLHVSRSLRKSLRRFTTTVDTAFDEVISACGDPSRPHGWIDDQIIEAYCLLHRMGIAHSVEVWDDDGLAGGLYGVAINGLFAGESMFHARTDASKVAMHALNEIAGTEPGRLIDVQWATDHLRRMGCRTISRSDYMERLSIAMELDVPAVFRRKQ